MRLFGGSDQIEIVVRRSDGRGPSSKRRGRGPGAALFAFIVVGLSLGSVAVLGPKKIETAWAEHQ